MKGTESKIDIHTNESLLYFKVYLNRGAGGELANHKAKN